MKQFKFTAILISLLLLSINMQNLLSQVQPAGNIKGKIIDSETRKPVIRATVTINDPSTKKQITGGFTDRNGDFNINVNPGNYFIKITFLGYETHQIQNVSITQNNLNFNAGTISLKMSSVLTQEVRVEVERAAVEVGLDRKVFNIEQDVKNLGGSAIDVLANIPSVTIDDNDNVRLRGNTDVRIMIDGRLSTLSASEALEQIPATMISSVELITNPGARYDAEGTAGIINIVTTRQREDGVNAMVNFNAGTDDALNPKLNGSMSANWNIGKWNIFANFSGRHGNRCGTGKENWTFYNGDTINPLVTSYFNEIDSLQMGGRFASGRIGTDYNITQNDVITYSLRVNQMKRVRDQFYWYDFMDADSNTVDKYERTVDNRTNIPYMLNTENAISYKRNFEQRGHELFADVFYTTWDRKNVLTTYQQKHFLPPDFTVLDGNTLFEKNLSNSLGRNFLAQLDYVRPIGTNLKIEVGAKFSNRLNKNRNEYDSLNNFTDGNWFRDTNRSDNFRYTERNFAQYFTASSSIGKFKYNAGLRSETTITGFDSYRVDSNYTYRNTRFFPSVYLSYELNPSHLFNLSFSSRIKRPTFWDINPATDYSKPTNLSRGNPTVKSESSYAGEGGYMLNIDKTTITATLFYRYTRNGIERYRSEILKGDTTLGMPDTTIITPQNVKSIERAGFEFIAMQKITDWWKIDGNYTLYGVWFDATNIIGGEKRDATNWTARLNSVMSFNKAFETQLTGSYRSKVLDAQGEVDPNWSLDASLKYNVSRQLSFSLRVQDISNSRQFSEYDYIRGVFYNLHAHHWYNRSYFVGMTYRFSDFKQRRDRILDENVREGGGEE